MDESFLDDAIPSVLSKTIFQTFILMLVMRVAWSVVSFDRDTKIVSLKHLESSRSLPDNTQTKKLETANMGHNTE